MIYENIFGFQNVRKVLLEHAQFLLIHKTNERRNNQADFTWDKQKGKRYPNYSIFIKDIYFFFFESSNIKKKKINI